MAGGTITITNVGVFGVDTGTPILNPGESAILCFGAVRDMPWVVDGKVAAAQVTQLALSFDHRVVDGAARLAVPGRRRPRARGPGHRPPLVARRGPGVDHVKHAGGRDSMRARVAKRPYA